MAIDFPNSPSVNDSFTVGNRTWIWDGTTWELLTTASDPIQKTIVDAKGDLIGGTGSDTVARLAVGTNEHRLVADSGETTGLKYVADTTNYAVGAKGDLLVGTAADTVSNLAVGTNGQLLVADSGETTGLKWTGSITNTVVQGLEESWNVAATAATGTVNFDTLTSTAWLYTSDATGNWTLNVRGDGSTTLASLLDTGDSITVVFAVTQGATPYYASSFEIDGSSVTPEWQGGSAPSAGNASSVDVYVYTIIKTAATPTYTVLASQTQFA